MAKIPFKTWRRLYLSLWGLVALCLLLVAAYVVLARQAMLLVPDYREKLELLFEEKAQTPLVIDELEGKMAGLVPQFVARRIRLPAPEGESPLELQEVVLSVDVLRSLLVRDLVLKELRIKGVALHLVRGDDGKVRLRGLDIKNSSASNEPAPIERFLRIFYRQQLLTVHDAQLSLDWPGMPPLAASRLSATLINDGDNHLLSLNVEARDRPLRLEAKAHLYDDAFALDEVDADLYLKVRGQRLEEWLPSTLKLPLSVEGLQGKLEFWGSLEAGQPQEGQLALSMPAVTLRDDKMLWPLSAVSARLALKRDDDQAVLSLLNLSGQTAAGQLRLGDMALQWDTEGEQRSWQARTGDLPLRALSQQLQQWPFALPEKADKLRELLKALSPQGVVDGLYVRGVGRSLENFQARFTGLGNQASGKLPGVSRLSGWVSGNSEQGRVHLYSDSLALNLPLLFDQPLAGQMAGVLDWRRDGDDLTVRSGRLRVVNDDAHGEAMVSVKVSKGQVPELRLAAEIYDGDGAQASRYIPLRKLSDGLADWLGQALQGGHLRRGQLLYQGPVKIDPDHQQDRTFQMRYQGEDIVMSILPEWPLARNVTADVFINGREVRGIASKGNIYGSEVSQVYVDVPAFATEQGPRLIVSGKLKGPLADLDSLMHDTPLQKQLPEELLDWRMQAGNVDGRLLLDFPFKPAKDEGLTVIVDGRVEQGVLENPARKLIVSDVKAPVYFHLRDGVQIPELQASVLGGKVTGRWETNPQGSQLALQGALPVSQLRDWLGFAWLSPASGDMPLEMTMDIPWKETGFALRAHSSLRGVAVDAPAPLGKKADTESSLDVEIRGEGSRQNLYLDVGNLWRGRMAIGQTPLRGDVVVGAGSLTLPESGISLRGQLARANAADWIDFISEKMVPAFERDPGEASGNEAEAEASISKVSLRIESLDLFGVNVNDASLSVLPTNQGWDLALSSKAIAGSVRIPEGFEARGDKPLSLSVSRMNIAMPAVEEGDAVTPPVSPLQLPPMDARLDNLRVDGEEYGEWKGSVRPLAQGVRISNLVGNWRFTEIEGSLDWTEQAGDSGSQYSRFSGLVKAEKLERALKAWDMPELIQSDDAQAKVVLGWQDWPLNPDYLALDGQARVDIGECRIPETDTKTSFLRVLGVLNLGTIQRRLRLNFSDLYKKGLSCDSITGDFLIEGPLVSTTNLQIRSPSAQIEVQGQMNLDKETLDHKMEVTLPLSSNLYAGCLAGPAACAGIFVVERIWGDKLDRTATLEYAVTGTWANPKVTETEGIFE
ncbi:YhdP family protein [Alcanivorax sediminis]|uniref:TIGR02099 family protein n=1 Tax=Alcanivorax sediminis TaxID=2663008 RepID=A0A6N7M3B0_9GAMM|nr:YhdP family protein [Alcanivorax sediminis]MQX54911.1 TIGR02099 family protein [Alcanivorax sediminis]